MIPNTLDPQSMHTKRTTLIRVATLNVFGIPFLTPNPAARMMAIGQACASLDLDLVGFQEVFTRRHCKILVNSLQMEHYCYFGNGKIGSGLLLASRHPLENVNFVSYSLKGRPEKIYQGQYLSNPGFGMASVQTPYGSIDVFFTHLIANFSTRSVDDAFVHRCAQIFELTKAVTERSSQSPRILLGDFNLTPDGPGYPLIANLADVRDAWSELYPGDDTPTVSTENRLVQARQPRLRKNERVDYIFYGNGEMLRIQPKNIFVGLTETFLLNDVPMNYSDHYAVVAELEISPNFQDTFPKEISPERYPLDDLKNIFSSGIVSAKYREKIQSTIAIFGCLITVVVSIGFQCAERILLKCFLLFAGLIFALITVLVICVALGSTQTEIGNLKSLLQKINLLKQKKSSQQ